MKLQETYFKIEKSNFLSEDKMQAIFNIDMVESHPVYQGHFPGEPVSPGVCTLQMIKECAQIMTGKEMVMKSIKQYRLLSVMTPQNNPKIVIEIKLTPEESDGAETYKIKATATDAAQEEVKFIDLSALLSIVE